MECGEKMHAQDAFIPPHLQYSAWLLKFSLVKYFSFTTFSSWIYPRSISPLRIQGLLGAGCHGNRERHPQRPACHQALYWLPYHANGNDVGFSLLKWCMRGDLEGWNPGLQTQLWLKAGSSDGLLSPKPLLSFTLIRLWRRTCSYY